MQYCNFIGDKQHTAEQYTKVMLDVYSDSFRSQEKIFPWRVSLMVTSSSCIIRLVSNESCMMLKKSIHVGTKAAYLKLHPNPIHLTDYFSESFWQQPTFHILWHKCLAARVNIICEIMASDMQGRAAGHTQSFCSFIFRDLIGTGTIFFPRAIFILILVFMLVLGFWVWV